ncbi:TPA: AcaB family transcriptional regulator [Klebsiella oxytoca]|uniref:AcaB family transcriptional regulator n=1 Tax=Klebsiella oxytoca TaxID=571 RepID=UPI001F485A1C|nr:AcaB family transcriptional regulator [Klebsiella oxytoca]
MSDKTEKKAGALHSELRIELHTQYAINTWSGRSASDGKPSLIGMPLFFRLISRISRDSLADNPWADAALVEVETLLETASQQLQKWLNDIDALMAMLFAAPGRRIWESRWAYLCRASWASCLTARGRTGRKRMSR